MRFGVRAVVAPLVTLAIIFCGNAALWAAEPKGAADKAAPATGTAPAAEEGSNWTAKRIYDAFRNESRCVLETPRVILDDGRQETKVFLRVDSRSLTIMTESNVDIGHADVGIQVDDKKSIKPDQVFLDQNLLFEARVAQIVEQFKTGLAVEARLRFWPTWPSMGLKTVSFSLVGFTRAFARLPGC